MMSADQGMMTHYFLAVFEDTVQLGSRLYDGHLVQPGLKMFQFNLDIHVY